MKQKSISKILSLFVKELKIPVTSKTIIDELQKHPSPNSLAAISDLLNEWGVVNAAYNLTTKELLDAGIPTPFIAYTNEDDFIIINKLTDTEAVLTNDAGKKSQVDISTFKSIISGSILIAEREESSGEAEYQKKRRSHILASFKTPVIITTAFGLILLALYLYTPFFLKINFNIASLVLLKLIGLTTTILLLIQSIDSNNPIVAKLCNNNGKSNCNAILSSSAANVFEWLSWSEVGFYYFSGTFVLLLFNTANPSVIQMLAILNICCLPYTAYSLYYQYRIVKQWCIFCCTVQVILWLEFFFLMPNFPTTIYFPNGQVLGSFILSFGIPVLTWMFLKPFFLKSYLVQPLKQQLNGFKYNSKFFENLLNDHPPFKVLNEHESIILGNPQAEHIVTIVSNPYCIPCSEAHAALEKWIDYRDDLKLQIIFSLDNDEQKNKIAKHFFGLKETLSLKDLTQSIHDWYKYGNTNYLKWAEQYPSINEKNSFEGLIDKHSDWCEMVNVTSTPTIFINGRKLPALYSPTDIKYIV